MSTLPAGQTSGRVKSPPGVEDFIRAPLKSSPFFCSSKQDHWGISSLAKPTQLIGMCLPCQMLLLVLVSSGDDVGKPEIPQEPWAGLLWCISARRECWLQTTAVFPFSCLDWLGKVEGSGSVDPLPHSLKEGEKGAFSGSSPEQSRWSPRAEIFPACCSVGR